MNGNDEKLWVVLSETRDTVLRIEEKLSDYDKVKSIAYEGRTLARELKEDFKTLCAQFWGVIAGIVLLAVAVLKDWLAGG